MPHTTCHIISAGAIGQYFAFDLKQKQWNVCLHARQNTLNQIELIDLNEHPHKINLNSDSNEPIELLIICTKAFDALDAFKQYQHRLTSQSLVICLFNGLGPQFEIKQLHRHTFFATTTVGAKKLSANKVQHTGDGETLIGGEIKNLNEQQRRLLDSLGFEICNDIEFKLFKKLAINSLINPLTVIYNCQNGDLLNSPNALSTMQALAQEIELLCLKEKIKLSAKEIFQVSCDVAQKTAKNFSSMHQDIHFKRKSEIALINGFWLTLANKHHIKCETNQQLIQQINLISQT